VQQPRALQVQAVAHQAAAPEPLPPQEHSPQPQPEVVPAPEAQAPAGMSLDQAINTTLLMDPRLRAGFQAINQASADALTASLKPNPELFTDVQLLPLTRPFTPTATGGPPQQDVNLTYPIDWYLFGKRAAEMASTALGVQVAQWQYQNLIRERVTSTAIAYYDVVEAKSLLDVYRQNVRNLDRVETITKKAVDLGGRPTVELNRVRLDLLQARQALREGELQLVTSKAQLRALFGQANPNFDFDVSASLDTALSIRPLAVDAAYPIALQSRPDLRSLRWRVSEANANMELERRRAYPSVAPTFGYTRQYQEAAMAMPNANSWSAALTMSLPINNLNQGNRAKAASLATQSRFDLRAGEVEILAEVQSVIQELETARINAEAVSDEQLQIADEVRSSINRAYELGGRPLIDVLDAQRNFSETYTLYINTRANYWRALYRYYSVLGQQLIQ
jgi:cobalt-zinc-cadmium efflux system outer membrane protein